MDEQQISTIRQRIAASKERYLKPAELKASPLKPLAYDTTFANEGKLRITLADKRIHWVSSILRLQGTPSQYLASFYEALTLGNPDVYTNFAGLVRFDSSGVIDTSFGDKADGFAEVRFSAIDYSMPHELIELKSGALLVAGVQMAVDNSSFRQTWMIARYKSDGLLDTGFAEEGIFNLTGIGDKLLRTEGIVELPDGKIIIAATPTQALDASYLVRLDANGQIDNSFGESGVKEIKAPNADTTHLTGLKLDAQGAKLLACGQYRDSSGSGAGAGTGFIAMLDSEGEVDQSFGVKGFVDVAPNQLGEVEVYSVFAPPQADHLLAAGYFLDFNTAKFASLLMRYLPDGSADTTFNNGDPVLISLDAKSDLESWQEARTLPGEEGNILAIGELNLGPTGSYSMVGRFNSKGKLDTSFANGAGIGSPVSASFFPDGKHVDEAGRLVCAGAYEGNAAIFALKI